MAKTAEGTMTSTIDKKIENDTDLALAIQGASSILEGILGRSKDVVTAEWHLGRDGRNRPFVELLLSDFSGSVAARFSSDELRKKEHLEKRLNWLWGDLLQIRSRKQVQKLREMVQQLEEP